MPVHKIVSNSTTVQIWTDASGPRSIQDIIQLLIDQGGAGNEDRVATALKDLLQADLDVRQVRNTLPLDDPDRTSNPNRPDLFWDGNELVGRSVEVVSVTWNGAFYSIVLRRTT